MITAWQNNLPVKLRCVEKWSETEDCVSILLTSEFIDTYFDFKPGQFINLGIEYQGKIEYRAYSISSVPNENTLQLTIKRVDGGKVSTYIVDKLIVGEYVHILKPNGDFNCIDHPPQNNRVLLISAGCGITPVYSMAQYWLMNNSTIDICFLHIAKDRQHTIFFDSLLQLNDNYQNFNLQLLLKDKGQTTFSQGRLDQQWLQKLVPDLNQRTIYLCGPEGFMQDVSMYLQQLNVNMANFYQESFTPIKHIKTNDDHVNDDITVNVSAFNQTITAKKGAVLADTLEDAALPILVACRSGVCGSCKCKVTKGTVTSSSTQTLTANEIEQGYVLACSSTLTTNIDVELN